MPPWKAGAELPPFVSTNALAISMLLALHDGTVVTVPSIFVSEAVAVQIWLLVFGKDEREVSLQHIGDRGFYIVLASLARGVRVETAPPLRVEALRKVFARKKEGKGDRSPGVVVQLRELVRNRRDRTELRGMNANEARDYLLLQCISGT